MKKILPKLVLASLALAGALPLAAHAEAHGQGST